MLKFYDQTIFSDHTKGTYGDCARACICTLLQSDLKDWPHSINSAGEWNDDFFDKLNEFGYNLKFRNWGTRNIAFPDIVGLSGLTIRGINHMVLYSIPLQTIIHDPHPSRAGLTTRSNIYFLERIK